MIFGFTGCDIASITRFFTLILVETKWWHWVLAEVLTGGAVSASITATSATTYSTLHATSITFQTTMSALDYSTVMFRGDKDNPVGNAFKIDLGMALIPMEPIAAIFGACKDESATGTEKFLTYVNYLLNGESIQDNFGNGFAHYMNIKGNIDAIGVYEGRTIIRVKENSLDYGDKRVLGVSHGHYVFVDNIALNPSDTDHDVGLFTHEFGYTY